MLKFSGGTFSEADLLESRLDVDVDDFIVCSQGYRESDAVHLAYIFQKVFDQARVDPRGSCASQLAAFVSLGWSRAPTAGELFNMMVTYEAQRHHDQDCPMGRSLEEAVARWDKEDSRAPKTAHVPADVLYEEGEFDGEETLKSRMMDHGSDKGKYGSVVKPAIRANAVRMLAETGLSGRATPSDRAWQAPVGRRGHQCTRNTMSDARHSVPRGFAGVAPALITRKTGQSCVPGCKRQRKSDALFVAPATRRLAARAGVLQHGAPKATVSAPVPGSLERAADSAAPSRCPRSQPAAVRGAGWRAPPETRHLPSPEQGGWRDGAQPADAPQRTPQPHTRH